MFDTGETLQDVKKWAEATFPHEFKAVKDYLRDYDITSSYRGPMNPKYRNLKATDAHIFGHCVHVGYLTEEHFYNSVFAHVTSGEGNERWVTLCDMDECCNTIGRSDTTFMKPFLWLNPDVNSVGFARFEALIMFMCLPSGISPGASIDTHQFKKHFEGACRVISGRLEEQTRQKGECN
jgi:hypothetical protein